MSTLMKPAFIKNIRKPDFETFRSRIEATVSPKPKLSSVNTAAPIAEAGYRSMFQLSASKRLAAQKAEHHEKVIAKYRESLDQKQARIQTLEYEVAAAEGKCKELTFQLRYSNESERRTSLLLAQATTSLSDEQAAHQASQEIAETEALRLVEFSSELRVEYFTAVETLKQTQEELTKLKGDVVELQQKVGSTQALLDLERTKSSQLEAEKANLEWSHAQILQDVENKRARLSVELASTQDELDDFRERFDSGEKQRVGLQGLLFDADEENKRLKEELEEKDLSLIHIQASLKATQEMAATTQAHLVEGLQVANKEVDDLAGRLVDMETALSSAHVELAHTQDVLRLVEEEASQEQADHRVTLDAANDKIAVLLAQAVEKDAALFDLRVELADTCDELKGSKEKAADDLADFDVKIKIANDKADALAVQVAEKDIALSGAGIELVQVQDELKLTQEKAVGLDTTLQAANDTISILEAQAAEKDVALFSAHDALKMAKEEAVNQEAKFEALLVAANGRIHAFEAQVLDGDAALSSAHTDLSHTQDELKSVKAKLAKYHASYFELLKITNEGIEALAEKKNGEIRDVLNALADAEDALKTTKRKAAAEKTSYENALDRARDKNIDLMFRIAEKDHALSKATSELANIQDRLKLVEENAANNQADFETTIKRTEKEIVVLEADVAAKDAALSDVRTQLANAKDAFKVDEEKELAREADRQASLSVAEAKIKELSEELLQQGEVVAVLSDAQTATSKDVLDHQAKNATLTARVTDLEAQLGQATAVNQEVALRLEDALSGKAEIADMLQEKEDIAVVLVQQLERECEAHQSTRDDTQSLQTRLAVASKDLGVAAEKVKMMEEDVEVANSERRVLEKQVQDIVEELTKENERLETSKKSIEELLAAKINRCDDLERENQSLRQSSLATLAGYPDSITGSPLSSITNLSTSTPSKRAVQKKTKGNSWFSAGGFAPITSSFKWSSPGSSPLASSSPVRPLGPEPQTPTDPDSDSTMVFEHSPKGNTSVHRGDPFLDDLTLSTPQC